MGSPVASVPEPRVERTTGTLALAAGDAALVALFVVAGEVHHGVDPLSSPLTVADTAVPFLLGWAFAGVVAGAYAPGVRTDARRSATRVTVAWVGAALLGQALRATAYFHGRAAPAFVLVSVVGGLLVLVPWRVAVAAHLSRQSPAGTARQR